MFFELGIKVLIVITSLIIVLYEHIDYKIPFLILNLFYISSVFLIISFYKGKLFKVLMFFIDVIFISIFSYLTSYPEISLFIFPLAVNFLENKKDIILFSVLSLVPLSLGLYISGFSEIIFIPIYIAFILSFLNFYKKLSIEKKVINEIKKDMESIYTENLKLQEYLYEYQAYKNIINLINDLEDRNISLEGFLSAIYNETNTKGIVFYDFERRKCIAIGELDCKKDIPKYLTTGFNVLEETKVNKEFLTKYIISCSIENKNHIYGFLICGYETLDDKEISLMKAVLTAVRSYYCS